ncbi:hypothetical protein EHQ96_00165 [Leptospira levettii]|uniref:hypothetical protein n=1 Tax=Leptospira levettii TaxID=2023178 RepID=UPI001083DDEB|nr:hypothetical protein [Leptospira levettii]TGM73617.1 hypothetical protein EHQ96_00165 [Leptospira levettii]
MEIIYPIKIEYDKSIKGASRIYRSMALLIESFQEYDEYIAHLIFKGVKIEQYLDAIEVSSLKSFIRELFIESDEDSLSSSKIKVEQVENYVKTSHRDIISTLNDNKIINSSITFENLSKKIEENADQSGLKSGNLYIPPLAKDLIPIVSELNTALNTLHNSEIVIVSNNMELKIDKERIISIDDIRKDMTKTTTVTSGTKILQLKKPDLLGNSKWDFKHGNHPMEVKILDIDWLNEIQSGRIPIIAGDSVQAKIRTVSSYDNDGVLIDEEHFLESFEKFIPKQKGNGELYEKQ